METTTDATRKGRAPRATGRPVAVAGNGAIARQFQHTGTFLEEVERFAYEARSIEAIIDQCSLAGKSRFRRSGLPPQNQLELHVDPAAFRSLGRTG